MLIPIATITQAQIDCSTNESTDEMAVLGTDYIVEVEEFNLIDNSDYAGLRRYTKKQMHKVIEDF
jgi:hypothetical protein